MIVHVPVEQIEAAWPGIEAGLQKAISMSHCETSAETVKDLLKNGKAALLLADGGFAVVEPYLTDRGCWLNIIFAYCESRKSVIEGYEYISELARRMGAVGVKLFSARPGMVRLARRLGMTPRFTEYVQEIR